MIALISVNPVVYNLTRWAGICGIVGGLALAAAYLIHPPSAPPETVSSILWIWVHVGFMISLLCGIFLLIGLMGQHLKAGGGYLGFTGFALAVISLVFVFGLDYAEVFIFPTLAVTHPDVVTTYGDGTMMPSVAFAFPITGVMFLVGFVLFGWSLFQTGVIGRLAAILTILGTIIFALGLSGMFPIIVVKIGATLFGCALVWLGIGLWMARQ